MLLPNLMNAQTFHFSSKNLLAEKNTLFCDLAGTGMMTGEKKNYYSNPNFPCLFEHIPLTDTFF